MVLEYQEYGIRLVIQKHPDYPDELWIEVYHFDGTAIDSDDFFIPIEDIKKVLREDV